MARIFISYRREDSGFWVSRLVDELHKHFPPEQVFQDIASIDPGADFKETLDQALAAAAVMLAVIGRGWLSATDRQGRRRLDVPADFVRQEIAESLRRPGVRVFPLLVNGAEMPSEEELPDPLKPLHFRQAFELTVRHWHQDVAQLVQTLKKVEQETNRREAEERAARDETARIAAEEQARKKADEEARRKAAEEARRKADEEARGKAAEEARRRAEEESKRREAEERAAQAEAQRKAAEEQAKKDAAEEARRKTAEQEAHRKAADEARRKTEEEDRRRAEKEAQRKAAEEESQRKAAEEARRKAAEGAGVRPPQFNWKVVVAIGAVVGAVALVVFISGGERPKPSPAPAQEAKQATPAAEKTEPPPSAVTSEKAATKPSATVTPPPAPPEKRDLYKELLPKEYKVRHILVANEADAKAIIAELKKGGNFEKIAAAKSTDPGSKTKGGDLGWNVPGNFVKPFGDALTSLKPGQITDKPVQTQFGWHVIKVEDERQREIEVSRNLR